MAKPRLSVGTNRLVALGQGEGERILERASEYGLGVDTAPGYCAGQAESLIGAALAGGRELSVTTKIGLRGRMVDVSPDWMEASSASSLERLGRQVALCLLHQFPVSVDLGAFVRCASRLAHSWGVCVASADDLDRMIAITHREGLPRPVALQAVWSSSLVAELGHLVERCECYGIELQLARVLDGGVLPRQSSERTVLRIERLLALSPCVRVVVGVSHAQQVDELMDWIGP